MRPGEGGGGEQEGGREQGWCYSDAPGSSLGGSQRLVERRVDAGEGRGSLEGNRKWAAGASAALAIVNYSVVVCRNRTPAAHDRGPLPRRCAPGC